MPTEMSGVEALCFFMERDNLRQQDLPEIGNQAKVSEVLSGRRAINLRQAKDLALRFAVPLTLFID
jgi:HTH-type transcriptional regulator/antitoxin HigA